jgi:hypothetical protein
MTSDLVVNYQDNQFGPAKAFGFGGTKYFTTLKIIPWEKPFWEKLQQAGRKDTPLANILLEEFRSPTKLDISVSLIATGEYYFGSRHRHHRLRYPQNHWNRWRLVLRKTAMTGRR